FSSRRRHTRFSRDWSSDVCSSDLADTTGATLQPLTREPDDEITVYSRTEFRPPRHVVIGGEVRDGGRFQWREGMTLRDLVLMARSEERRVGHGRRFQWSL